MRLTPHRVALRASLLYAGVASGWIICSDYWLGRATETLAATVWVQTAKGLAFVAVTALLLYGWLRVALLKWETAVRQRHEAERSLAEKAEHLQRIVRAAKVGLWEWEVGTNKVFFSPEWKRQIGYDEAEIPHDYKEWESRVHPEDLPRVRETARAFVAKPWPDYQSEFRFRHKDGEYRWIMAGASLEYDESGRAVRMLGSHLDVTQRKQADEALRASKQQLQSILDSMFTFVGLLSLEGICLECNQAPLVATALRREDVIGRPFVELPVFSHSVAVQDQARAALRRAAAGETVREDFSIQIAGGIIRVMDGTFGPLRDATGRITHVVGSGVDVTERKEAEKRIQHLNRVYSVLTAINETIVRVKDSAAMLAAICRIAVEKGNLRMAWVGLVDMSSGRLQVAAQAGANAEVLKLIEKTIRRPDGCAFTSEALRAGRRSVCNDVENDPATVSWRGAALEAGYRAMTSLPLKCGERTIGTFNLYAAEAGYFDEEEMQLLDELAVDISFALEIHQEARDRARAEEALAESENRLRTILESEPECVKLVARDGTLIDMNRAGLSMVEADSAAQVLGTNVCPIILPEHREHFLQLTRQVFEGIAGTLEFEIVGLKGTRRWLEMHATPLRDKTGQITAALSVTRDITASKSVADALRESELRFHSVWEKSVDGMRLIDSDGRIVAVNAAFCRLVGMRREQLEGQPFTITYSDERANEEMQDRFRERFAQRMIPDRQERRVTFRSGQTADLEITSAFLKVSGKPTLLLGLFRDITQRKKTESELRESEERFRLLVENSSDVINIIDQRGIIRFQSPSGERILRYTPAEMVGRNALELIHPDDVGAVRDAIQRALSAPQAPVPVEFRLRHRDGTWRTFEALGKAMPSQDSEGWILVNSRDVTESRKLAEQLRQSQKMDAIGQLSGGVAHDFNNILTVIQGHASLIPLMPNISASARESVGEIQRAAERAAALTRQLLMFSRRQTMDPRDLDLNEIVSGTMKMLQRILGEDIRMQVNYASQPLFTHADRGMLDQVLLNLAVNSRDAMPKGGRMIIETSAVEVDETVATPWPEARPGSFVCLSVSDTGCGIPKENLPRIFEPFFTTKDIGKGTGLGLATVYGIVQQHRGWINVESEVDLGTTFRICLPWAAPNPVEEAKANGPFAALRGSETILLVEDEPSLRKLVGSVLTGLGYRVIEAPNGRRALEVWHERRDEIQLLLTDLVMPDGMSGIELAERLLLEKPEFPVIYTSGYSEEIAGKDFPFEEGVNFVPKPFDPHTLAQAVRGALRRD